MKILKIIMFSAFCLFVTECFLLYSKAADAQTKIKVLDAVVDPEVIHVKEQKEMKKKIAEIEEIRDDYIMAYPEYKPRIALRLIQKTVDAPLIALPETLRESIIDLGLGTEIDKLPKTIHKPTYENTKPLIQVQIPKPLHTGT